MENLTGLKVAILIDEAFPLGPVILQPCQTKRWTSIRVEQCKMRRAHLASCRVLSPFPIYALDVSRKIVARYPGID
jgi:hypothetical protein